MDRSMSLRRATGYAFVFILFGLDIYATGLFGGGERTLAVVRSIVLPGLPFLEWHLPLGLATIGVAIASIAAWLRWGVDWLPVLVMSGAVTVAALVMPLHHAQPAAGPPHAPGHHEASDVHYAPHAQGNSNARHDAHAHGAALSVPAPSGSGPEASPGWIEASHEFTVVLVVFALVARLSLLLERIPGTTRLQNLLPAGLLFPAVDRARAATLALLAGAREPAIEVLGDPQLLRRATRVNRWARFRSRGDPLSGAHASLRAGLAIAGMLSDARRDALRAEARTSLAGVPVSEPTWVRPLDGMLAACALQTLGETGCVERWRRIFEERFGLRHGRRPAALHAPTMLGVGTAPAWEHAAATALGYRMGWIGGDDWQHLRRRCLGKAASGARDADALRFIAAGRLWAGLLHDTEALAVLGRRTLDDDPIAQALCSLADRVRPAPAPASSP